MTLASNKKDYINLMNKLGYDVLWSDDRKYITYSIIDTKLKCWDKTLHEEKYLKENMENEFKLRQSKKEEFQCSADTPSRSKRDSSRQRAMAGTASGIGYQRTDDRLSQQDVREHCEQENSQGPINTGWESERQDYFNGQVSQEQDEGIYDKGIRDNVSDSSYQQSNLGGLDVPTSSIIDDDSGDPEVRELHRKQEEAQRAAAMAFDLIADGIIRHINNNEVEDDYNDIDDRQGWGPTMGGI